jgi:mono/diheme cytochrome c family protein
MRPDRNRSARLALAAALALAAGCSKGGGEAQAENVKHGKQVFETTCATCHAPDGTGVKGLGKSLVDSEYVRKSSDADLVKMAIAGRPVDDPLNTTKVAMPPRGGNAALSDSDIADAVSYVRTLNKK